MNTNLPSNPQPVQVLIDRILPFGVFVTLPDGKKGYIRRRELDLDADIDPSEILQVGQSIQAVIIKNQQSDTHIELSRRATLKDPWPSFTHRYYEGDIVRGRVQAFHPNGIFVRIESGIDGFIPLMEISTWGLSKPEELLWLSDDIEAVITQIDKRNRKLTLSIRARMQQLSQATHIMEQLVEHKSMKEEISMAVLERPLLPVTAEERDKVGQIFVIDDDEGIRNGLVEWLQERGYDACAVWPCEEIFSFLQPGINGIVIVDIHLSSSDGIELVNLLYASGNRMPVCVMSSSDWLLARSDDIRDAKVFQVFEKPLDKNEIDRFLHRLAHGKSIRPAWQILPRGKERKTEAQILDMNLANTPLLHRLQTAVTHLVELSRAEKGILFFNDPISQAISILTEAGTLPLEKKSLYKLKESPVKDVIIENFPVMEGHASENKRFDKLLELFRFDSCIGFPVQVLGDVHHAFFLFHRKPDAFARIRPQYMSLDAIWLGTILEEQAIQQRLRTINPLILSGELALSLAHEVYNKVDSLDLQSSNILLATSSSTDLHASLAGLQNSILDLKSIVGSFQQMMRAKEIPTAFDINDVILRSETLLLPLARKEGIKINLHLEDNLPQVTGNAIALQQVFFNIMLNAVQHMASKPDKHRLLEISTSNKLDEGKQSVTITFVDTGLGIHKQLLGKIFELGFSTRGGSGLGLYIASSLIEMFDGSIKIMQSTIPLGTTIQVNLPI